MVKQKTAVLIPSAYRHASLRECLVSLFDNTPLDQIDVYVSVFRDDHASAEVARQFNVTQVYRERSEYEFGAIHGWLKLQGIANDYQFYVNLSDEMRPRAGWLEAALRAMHQLNDDGLVGLNDTHSDGNEYAAVGLVSRSFLIKYHGGSICSPRYRSWWCDREITDLAKSLNLYLWAQDSIMEHLNHAWGGIAHDQTYVDAEKNYDNDYQLYMYYKNNGFPIDWEPVLR
jgi:hypothetical protein